MPTDKKPGTPTDRPCVVVVCWKHVGSQPQHVCLLLFKSDKLRLLWSRLSILWFAWCYPWQGSSGMWYVLTSQCGSSQLPFLLYSRVFDLSQISPDSGLCDLLNFLLFLPYVLFCLCRPRHELLPLNVIDAELVSFGQWSLLQCTILVIYVSVPARFCLTTALPANSIW